MESEKLETLGQWIVFLSKNIKEFQRLKMYLRYVVLLYSRNIPVVFDLKHLSACLSLNIDTCASLINCPQSFYYNFSIPKRNGTLRQISAPFPVMYHAQIWIYKSILQKIKVHDCAVGFLPNKSIINNALPHLNNPIVLKMDLKDFFPSIKIEKVINILNKQGYTKKVSYYLASICCLDKALPQGAPTSPMLSNIIAYYLDKRLYCLALKWNLVYTRYADDITFSGEKIPVRFIKYVTDIIENEGFNVNENKTQLLSKSKRKVITGISISSGKMTVPKEKRREIRQIIYYIKTKGISSHMRRIDSYDPLYIERILGYLYFWKYVEPDNLFVMDSIALLKQIQFNSFDFLSPEDYLF